MHDAVTALISVAGAALLSVVVYFLKERRKNTAESEIAERTVEQTISKADTSALEAHMLAVEKAFKMERESYERQLIDMGKRVTAVSEELTSVKIERDELKTKVDRLETQVSELIRRLGPDNGRVMS
jgi:predicted RNase H-like nuclease (RuvC/YqgF family)